MSPDKAFIGQIKPVFKAQVKSFMLNSDDLDGTTWDSPVKQIPQEETLSEGIFTFVVVSRTIPLWSSSNTILTWPSLEARCNPLSPFYVREQSRPHTEDSQTNYKHFYFLIKISTHINTDTCRPCQVKQVLLFFFNHSARSKHDQSKQILTPDTKHAVRSESEWSFAKNNVYRDENQDVSIFI